MSDYLCYMITTGGYTHTYVGITHDMKNRLRQHNGEISGGAKATSRFRDWEVAFYVTGFAEKSEVLSFEWRMHHPDGKRKKDRSYFGVLGRVRGLLETLIQPRFEKKAYLLHATPAFQTFVQTKDPALWTALSASIQITTISWISLASTPSPPPCPDQNPDEHRN